MADITTGLVAHYKLDDDAASTTVVATVGTNGTLAGGDTTDDLAVGAGGGPGGALLDAGLTFDGVADYVTFPDLSSALDDELTFSTWVQLAVATPATLPKSGLLCLGESFTGGTQCHYPYTDGKAYLTPWRGETSSVTSRATVTLPAGVTRTNWHLLSITSTPGTGGWKFYVNDQLIATDTGKSPVYLAAGVWQIGKSKHPTDATSAFLNGSISDTRIYSRALSADDVAALYDLAKPQATTLPTMSGSPTVGSTVGLESEGNWTDGTTDEWRIEIADDTAGTNPTYPADEFSGVELTSDHLGKYARVYVERSNDIGTTRVYSEWVGPIRAAGGATFGVVRPIMTTIRREIKR
jgi:hypothetical protein